MAKSLSIKSNVKPGRQYHPKKGKKFGQPDLSFNKVWKTKNPEELNTDPPMGLIQGRIPDSMLEWRVYLGIVRFKWNFIYQYAVRGGKSRRGGMVLDFLLLLPPLPRPVFCQGKFWHEVFKNPLVEKTQIDRMMNENRGQFGNPIMILEDDVQSGSDAYWLLSKEVLHG